MMLEVIFILDLVIIIKLVNIYQRGLSSYIISNYSNVVIIFEVVFIFEVNLLSSKFSIVCLGGELRVFEKFGQTQTTNHCIDVIY